MAGDGAAVRVDGLSKRYRISHARQRSSTMSETVLQRLRRPWPRTDKEDFWALRGVSAEIAKGETVGIIGRNGAGKSTLLKILSRIVTPTEGTVRLYGQVGSLLEVGTGFHPELTGRENVFLNGALLGMKRREIQQRFDSIVDFAQVERFLDTPVKRYSSGMYVRLAFSVAAHLNPDILVVDEVLAVGDAEFQKKCLGKMGEASTQEGRTVIFVSHNMTAIESLCRRTLFLSNGKVAFDGPTPDAIGAYLAGASQGEHEAVGVYDLMGIERRNTAKPILRRMEVRNGRGELANSIRMGESVEIAMDVEGLTVATHIVIIRLITDTNVGVVTLGTHMKPVEQPDPGRSTDRLVLTLDNVPLVPGRYWVEITVWERGSKNRLADLVERAGSIEVVAADVYGSGFEVSGGRTMSGFVYLDMRWQAVHNGVTTAKARQP